MSSVNVERLLAGLAAVEAAAAVGAWDQSTWRARAPELDDVPGGDPCGTAMCFAGHVVALAGGRWVHVPPTGDTLADHLLYADAAEPHSFRLEIGAGSGLDVISARDRAMLLLGLDEDQADELFCSWNSLEDLRVAVAELVAGASPSGGVS